MKMGRSCCGSRAEYPSRLWPRPCRRTPPGSVRASREDQALRPLRAGIAPGHGSSTPQRSGELLSGVRREGPRRSPRRRRSSSSGARSARAVTPIRRRSGHRRTTSAWPRSSPRSATSRPGMEEEMVYVDAKGSLRNPRRSSRSCRSSSAAHGGRGKVGRPPRARRRLAGRGESLVREDPGEPRMVLAVAAGDASIRPTTSSRQLRRRTPSCRLSGGGSRRPSLRCETRLPRDSQFADVPAVVAGDRGQPRRRDASPLSPPPPRGQATAGHHLPGHGNARSIRRLRSPRRLPACRRCRQSR